MSNDARPLYFPSGDQTLFGWLHPARGPATSDAGVVICNPFAYEAVCAHGSLRAFADICAAAGIPALRFDYSGTGDSSGIVGEGDQISSWCDDIRAATEFLERTCGVRRICLLGVRLGALLAGLAAAQGAIDAVIAVVPVTSGRRYLRELRALQAGASVEVAGTAPADEAGPAPADVGLEVTGFRLSRVSVESLERVDLSKLSDGPRASALILDRDDLPGAKPWAAALESEGVDVHYEALPGFTNMVCTPHAATVPIAMTEAMAQWLELYSRGTKAAAAMPLQIRLPAAARMRIKDESGVDLIERAMFIDGERALFAIVTEPAERAVGVDTSGYGVVMLNGGATNHIGPNRMYVELSRCWAARGYVVLRLDLAGLGDSATRPGEDKNQVYPPGALYDVGVAIEFLRGRRGVRNVTLAGLCAGAYHALRSAISGLPVNTVLLVNPLTFYWKQGSTLNDLQISEVVRNPGVYVENSFSLRRWSKLLRGRVSLWRVARVFVRRGWLTVDSTLRDLCRKLRIRIPDDLGWDLQSVAARGIRIVFFFARGDAGSMLLKVQGGSVLKRLGDRIHVHTIDGADHIFTQRAARMRLLQLMSSELPY
jgi:alpha-beta hydrolase superfamily lysophospholipase